MTAANGVFIIAEAGVNHNGSVKIAKKLVDAAVAAGADAVKFQTFNTELVVSRDTPKAEYQKKATDKDETQLEMLKGLELNADDFKQLANYARKKNIIFLSSPFDKKSVDLLDEIGVPSFKVASGEITNLPLLKYIAGKGRPVILSTGMSSLEEVEEAIKVIKDEGLKNIVLLHCVTSYPAKIEDVNLKTMQTMKSAFKLPVGFSDHTMGITIPIAAVAQGACMIEKHFTLGRNLPGPDHKASLEPGELKELVKAIRDVEKALGDGIKRPTKGEERNKEIVRKSIIAKVDIPKGLKISKEMLDIKRPGTGIEPKFLNKVMGKRTRRDTKKDTLIEFKDLK